MKTKNWLKGIIAACIALVFVISGVAIYVGNEAKAAEVNTDMLGVKFQVANGESNVIRFITSVDSLEYVKAGFEVVPNGGSKMTYETTTVYERIASTTDGVEYSFSPKTVDTSAEYFVTAKLRAAADKDYTVRAYVVTKSGETVYGAARCVGVTDGKSANVLNLSYKSENAPAVGTKVDVTYGKENTATTADIIMVDGKDVSVRVNVDPTTLPSATKFTFGTTGSAIYRNLYTQYAGAGTEDTTWYDVYQENGDTEFVIATTADMYGLASVVETKDQMLNKSVYLVSDLALNDGRPVIGASDVVTWKSDKTPNNWNPVGTNMEAPFKGTFDGQGHTISGLYCYDTENVAGLFESADENSTIRDFRIEDSYVFAKNGYAGSVAGKSNGVIGDIYSRAIIQNNQTTDGRVGGLVGEYVVFEENAEKDNFYRCWFDGALLGTRYYNGGIAGYVYGYVQNASATFTDCLVTGTVKGYSHTGGIIGISPKGGYYDSFTINLNNCLSAGSYTTSGASACGGLIGGIQNKTTNIATSYTVNDCGTNFTKLFGEQGTAATTIDTAATAAKNIPWRMTISGTNASTILGLDGADSAWQITDGVPELKQFSENTLDIEWYTKDPSATEFTISTASELYSLVFLAQTNNFAGKTIKLADDIVLNEGDAAEWKTGNVAGLRRWWSIGDNDAAKQFKGTFDGQGHTVSGMYGTYSAICRGMFGTIGKGGAVKNLRLVNSYFYSTTGYLGSIVGRSDGGKFSQIYSDAYVIAGGAWNNGSNPMYIGGIAGTAIATNDGTDDVLFSECWYNGALESKSMRNGGIVGGINDYPSGGTDITFLEDCLFTGSVWTSSGKHTNGQGTAGIVGCLTSGHPLTLKNCITTDDVVCVNNQFGGALYGAAAYYSVTNTTFDNCYVIGRDVVPFSMGVHSAFTGSVNGSATIVDSLSDAATMATASSAWTLVNGVPVLTVFKDIQP